MYVYMYMYRMCPVLLFYSHFYVLLFRDRIDDANDNDDDICIAYHLHDGDTF